MATITADDFVAPGPGLWMHNAEHFPRPVSKLFERSGYWTRLGVQQGTQRYGSFAGGANWRYVHRIQYVQPTQVVPVPASEDEAAKRDWERQVAASPEAQARIATAERVFTDRIWREDVARWDQVDKPSALQETRRLAAIDPGELEAGGLTEHLGECFAHLANSYARHHHFNGTWQVPVGRLLAQSAEWGNLDSGRVLRLLEGSSPISAGRTPEMDAVVVAIRADGTARRLLDSDGPPGRILAELRAASDEVGRAVGWFLDTFGYAMVGGFDPIDTYALERPGMLVAQMRETVAGDEDSGRDQRVLDETASARDEIPTEHRASFDRLLEEARFVYRIKDERGVYNNQGAGGLLRRAVLEAGRRLAELGAIEEAEHLVEGDLEEIQEAITDPSTLDAASLVERYEFRLDNSDVRAPSSLGRPGPQVPLEWFPEPVQAVQRALAGARASVAVRDNEGTSSGELVSGAPAGIGRYSGPARVVLGPGEYHRIEEGDVLVTTMTTPSLSAWMTMIGAIVTDHGGALSHAAVVAREVGIPAVTGTGDATTRIGDGERVVVDSETGTVERAS